MSKHITDEELRAMLHSFDEIDIDLDNMPIEEVVFSDDHNRKMEEYFNKLRAEEKENVKQISFKRRYNSHKIVTSIFW